MLVWILCGAIFGAAISWNQYRNGGAVRYAKSVGAGARFIITF
ncbi:hypothetical protein RBA41_27945 [Massilia sp. CCM 9210]|nr:hypothetical protein [Massilia sp. CCM 9210]MDQ1817145.1 hypothetical protein [Massilia sp. CCM 9210]